MIYNNVSIPMYISVSIYVYNWYIFYVRMLLISLHDAL